MGLFPPDGVGRELGMGGFPPKRVLLLDEWGMDAK